MSPAEVQSKEEGTEPLEARFLHQICAIVSITYAIEICFGLVCYSTEHMLICDLRCMVI